MGYQKGGKAGKERGTGSFDCRSGRRKNSGENFEKDFEKGGGEEGRSPGDVNVKLYIFINRFFGFQEAVLFCRLLKPLWGKRAGGKAKGSSGIQMAHVVGRESISPARRDQEGNCVGEAGEMPEGVVSLRLRAKPQKTPRKGKTIESRREGVDSRRVLSPAAEETERKIKGLGSRATKTIILAKKG